MSTKTKVDLRARKRIQLICTEPTRTQQHMKDMCDINSILKRYRANGELPSLIKDNPQFGDFSNVKDYQESLNIVLHANEQFAALSSHVREKFKNDPAEFLQFVSDPKNGEELVKMGLATPREQLNERDVPKAQSKSSNEPKKGSDETKGSEK